MQSQLFVDNRDGSIVDLIPLSEIKHFDEYRGHLQAGDVARPVNIYGYKVGQRVQVSDGANRPPERFNKKLAAWKRNNYTGTVKEISTESALYPHGSLGIEPDGRSIPGCIEFVCHVPLRGSLSITIIE